MLRIGQIDRADIPVRVATGSIAALQSPLLGTAGAGVIVTLAVCAPRTSTDGLRRPRVLYTLIRIGGRNLSRLGWRGGERTPLAAVYNTTELPVMHFERVSPDPDLRQFGREAMSLSSCCVLDSLRCGVHCADVVYRTL